MRGKAGPRPGPKTKNKPASPGGQGKGAPAALAAPVAWPEEMLAPLGRFKPWPGNARKHPPEQIALLAQILLKRGPDQPIVVDEDWIILKGHGRLEAATKAKLETFPFVQRFGLSEVEKREIRLEDNAVPLMSTWDLELLRVDAVFLQAGGGLAGLGFDSGFLEEVFTDPRAAFPTLRAGDRQPYQQMTFTLHDSQATVVSNAIAMAKAREKFSGPNENSNGNALDFICASYLKRQGAEG